MGVKTLGFVAVLALLATIGVLVWWLVTDEQESDSSTAGFPHFTTIPNTGEVFWWFFPTTKNISTAQPIILWIDGVLGQPPSYLANYGMFGPIDYNNNHRPDSWVNSYNLLFIDTLGTGFSQASNDNSLPKSAEEASEQILAAVKSFYTLYEDYQNAPLVIFGQSYGAQIGLYLSAKMLEDEVDFVHNLRGVVINNGIIAPGVALTKLGFYLEELGYIDGRGRDTIENLSQNVNGFVESGELETAFESFILLEDYINENAGAISVNLGHIINKESTESTRGYFGQYEHSQKMLRNTNMEHFMEQIADSIGITSVEYNSQSEAALQALKQTLMIPATDILQHILNNTDLSVHVINGNLDAVSNTPGQLEWINNLVWEEKDIYTSSPRQSLIVNSLVEGHFKRSPKFSFYWMNAAGQSVALDSPAAMRRVLDLIMEEENYKSLSMKIR